MQTTQQNLAVANQQHASWNTNPTQNSGASLEQVEQALTFIDASDRKVWIDCGMGIKAEFGEVGFDAWDSWSATADNYQASDAIASWKSFKSGGGITIATLFKLAMDNGYRHHTMGRPTQLTPEEIAKRAERIEADAAVLKTKRAKAATRAQAIWDEQVNASEAAKSDVSEHPYLRRKGILPHGAQIYRGGLTIAEMDCNGAIMLPMKLNGNNTGLQFISKAGEKRFLPDAEKGGFLIGKIESGKTICICEGFATGSSIHEATGYAVIVAFDAGNLQKIATGLRANFPDAVIVLCADDDESGVGQRKATEAAQTVGGLIATPIFPESRTYGVNDFNDLATLQGLEFVANVIAGAKAVVIEAPVTATARSNANGWPVPQPLTVKIDSKPYPLDALPTTLRAAVEEVAGFVKAPMPMVASCAISAVSLAIQGLYDVQRAEKLHSPVGLFLLTVAESGERKSTCDGFFMKAIRDYEDEQAELAIPALKDYKAATASWEAKCSGVKEKIRQLAKENKSTVSLDAELCNLIHDEPAKPRTPRIVYADVTPEAMAYALAMNWPSGGVVSAEAGIVFGSHAMSGDSVMRNLATLNQLWDGNSLKIDRRSSESFEVKSARLTMSLQVQSATLQGFLDKSGALARGTGFLARFLLAIPESTQGGRAFTEAPTDWPKLDAFNSRITALLSQPAPIEEDGSLTPQMMTLMPEAKAAWIVYHDAVESDLASGGELFNVRDVASKSADNATRLAALFHIFEGGLGAISADAFERASRIAEWHLNESRLFFGELALPVEMADAARLDKWLIEHCKRESTHHVSKRHTRQYGTIRDGKRLDAAISELVSFDRIQVRQDGKQISIWLNPALMTTGSEL